MGYPFYRFLILLIAGILCARFFPMELLWIQVGLVSSVFLLIGLSVLPRTWIWRKTVFGLIGLVFFFFFGIGSYQVSKALPDDHFTDQDVIGKDRLVRFQLSDQLSSNDYNTRFYADVLSVDGKNSSGRILVLFKRSDSVDYRVGQQLLVYDDINDASNARNPGDFNYKEYLKSINVYGQIYVDKPAIFEVKDGFDASRNPIENLKQTILSRLDLAGLDEGPQSMIEALVLGQRQNIDSEITKSFRDAGVIHILALSGLHVGIILIILKILTQPLIRLKYGRWFQSVLIIFLLWCFAIMTGLSPSILRAVTMFSFVAIGMNIKRKASTFHSLTLSAFFLLLYDARLLFQVGFQLSYTAVYAIVLLQPILRSLWKWHNPVKNFLWGIFTVTLAAQIGVAPLSVYYFHQLPGLFLVGNMILLPLLPFIIGASLLLIVLLLSGAPVAFLVMFLNNVLNWIIDLVAAISSFDGLIFKDLYLETHQLILIYVILFGLALFIRPFANRSKKEAIKMLRPNSMLHISLVALLFLLIGIVFQENKNQKNQMLLLHQARGSAISLISDDRIELFVDLTKIDLVRREISLERLKNIEPHRNKSIKVRVLQNSIDFEEVSLIRIDSTGVWSDQIDNPVVLISHSPKINIQRLIKDLSPKAILSDGSNYRSSVEKWKRTCEKEGIPFYNTYNVGAIDLTEF
ncbi:MAG: ComEC/Rec2 family competence protein [Nonlabens sp.]